jgi:hypothetical protein
VVSFDGKALERDWRYILAHKLEKKIVRNGATAGE